MYVPKGGVEPAGESNGGKTYVGSLQGKALTKALVFMKQVPDEEAAREYLAQKGWCYLEKKKNCGGASYIDEKRTPHTICDNRCDVACDTAKPPVQSSGQTRGAADAVKGLSGQQPSSDTQAQKADKGLQQGMLKQFSESLQKVFGNKEVSASKDAPSQASYAGMADQWLRDLAAKGGVEKKGGERQVH